MLNPGNPRVSVRLGRLPVRTLDEARAIVDKIIGYETAAPFDPWRNRVTFVADDVERTYDRSFERFAQLVGVGAV